MFRLREAINLLKVSVLLFLNMTKAFDCIVHSIILELLAMIGARGVTNGLIYLLDRKHDVCVTMFNRTSKCVQEVRSKYLNMLGVPQGSKLGLLYFIIYNNEIRNLILDYYVH